MIWRVTIAICCLWGLNVVAGGKTKIILDTDIGGDIDDLGALAVLNVLADKGECEILAVMSCVARTKAVNAIDAVNTYFGRPNIPIAHCDGKVVEWNRSYCEYIAEKFPHDLDGTKAPEATYLYRKILEDQPDHSVVIVSVGGLRNIRNLLKSPGDKLSPLTGRELLEKKVNRLVTMGGTYPTSKNGAEANFQWSGEGYAKYVVENFPRPQIFSGSEIGLGNYRTGEKLNQLPDNSPIKQGYLYFMKHPPKWAGGPWNKIIAWPTFDQCAVLVGVRGSAPYFTEITGHNQVDESGKNSWKPGPNKDQAYLKEKMPAKKFVTEIIEKLMMTLPVK